MPKISIIIPTFNRKKYIIDCVNSVLSQTYKDIEIIIVDDNSTDNTKDILSKLINSNHVKYFQISGKGPSNARNLGLEKSSGEYVSFLDSDDLFLPNKLTKQVELITKNPKAKFIHSNFYKFDDFGNFLGTRDTSFFTGHIYPEILSHWKELIAISCVMIKSEIFQEIGIFDESLLFGEDLDMWARISKKYEFHHVPEILTKIRIHENNLSKRISPFNELHKPYINKIFDNNKDLTNSEKKKVDFFYHLYVGLNYLIEGSGSDINRIRKNLRTAININPLIIYNYVGLIASYIPSKIRLILGGAYRKYSFNTPILLNTPKKFNYD